MDDAGSASHDIVDAETERREATWPIALEEHMRIGEHAAQPRPAAFAAQVGERRALAAAGVGNGVDVGKVRRVDEHHVGAMGRKRATGDGSGEDAREVEDAHALERPRR